MLDKWREYKFISSTRKTPEFIMFARDFKKYIRSDKLLIRFTVGHFYISGFAYNPVTKKYAYFITNNVAFYDNWHKKITYRTARHDRDYVGGTNMECDLSELIQNLERITE